ncbi:MAG: alpha/beta hydrolase [Pseudomonadota bacterium]
MKWLVRALALMTLIFGGETGRCEPLETITETRSIFDVNGKKLTYHVERTKESSKLPTLVVIDGSGCLGALRKGFIDLMSPSVFELHSFARVTVAKRGVPPKKSSLTDCSDAFKKDYSMDFRVLDHIRVLQHLRNNADWWNGEFLIFGWSDGGDIATEVFALTPDASRLVFGGVGGGYSMREHFEDFWVCPEDQVSDRSSCLSELRATFDDIAATPIWGQSWSGDDNTYLAWSSRLDRRLTYLLKDEDRPVLMIHGDRDFDGAPVESARVLAKALEENVSFSYWEIDDMEHGMWSLEPELALELESRALSWLLQGENSARVDEP